jgi:hypothetical protein
MSFWLAFTMIGLISFVIGFLCGTWDRRNVVNMLATDRKLALAQRREYERECLGLRALLGINSEADDARAGVLARESGVVFDEEDFLP